MSLAFCILASGSAGNCTAVLLNSGVAAPSGLAASHPERSCILFDAGLSPRRTHRHLARIGVGIEDLAAIVLTHLDSDHFHGGWRKIIQRRREDGLSWPSVYVHRRHRSAAWRAGLTAREIELFEHDLQLPCGAVAEPILLAHDDLGSVGFVLEHEGHRLGYATDLGRVPRGLLDRFINLHALAIESNYDAPMQHESARPMFLKRRIMDGRGHLSNEEALQAVRHIERRGRSRLSHIALLHLSEECNCPQHVRRLWQREMPHAVARLTITHQRRPTPLLHVTRPAPEIVIMRQPSLFDMLEAGRNGDSAMAGRPAERAICNSGAASS